MQRKKLLSACIAMALSSQTWAADTLITDSSDVSRKSSKITCPANIKALNKEQLAKLPPECTTTQERIITPWTAVGITALVTGLAVYALNDDNNHNHDNSSDSGNDGGDVTPPDDGGDVTPPDDGGNVTPPDDGGNVTPPDDGGNVTPPDDGGNVTPPDDGGNVTPPDDGGNVTPPDDGGNVTPPDDGGNVTPPDDGGNVTPPDDGGNVTPPDDGGNVTPPDDGGNVTPPDDGGNVTPPDDGGNVTPPDDGGNVTPPTPAAPIHYDNNVIWDKDGKTLQIRNATFTYTENADGSYTLTAKDGRTTIVNSWQVHEATNTAVFTGVDADGMVEWNYDDDGHLNVTKVEGVVVDGADGKHIKVQDATITDQGGNTALNGGTVLSINGDNIVLNNEGTTTATGNGSVVGVLTGNNIVINNIGKTIVDGGTAVIVDGDSATINNTGDAEITNGGTGSLITGDNATTDNIGTMTVDGQNSTGTKIIGDDATVKQEGDLFVSGSAHGIDITGNRAKIGNKGKITVVDQNSIGVRIEGDNATFINVGDIDVSNAGTGVDIAGNAGNVSLAGNMQVGDFATGLNVAGNNNSITLATEELNVTGQKATGVNIAGDDNTVEISGNILVDKDQRAGNAEEYFYDPSVGLNVSGNNNSVTLDGSLTVVSDSEMAPHQYMEANGSQETIHGLYVSGNGNNVVLNGGVNLVGEENAMSDAGATTANKRSDYSKDSAAVIIDGQSSLTLHGNSTITGDFGVGFSTALIEGRNGAYIELSDDAIFDASGINSLETYDSGENDPGTVERAILAVKSGSTLVNNGHTLSNDVMFITVDGADSTFYNNGVLESSRTAQYAAYDSTVNAVSVTGGAKAVNSGTITSSVTNQSSVLGQAAYFGYYSVNDTSFDHHAMGVQGMSATAEGSYLLNDTTGEINIQGRGAGMTVNVNASELNKGTITIDPMWKSPDDTTSYGWTVSNGASVDYGAGMGAGATISGNGGTAVNQGTITVYNAGAGMAAVGQNTLVMNEGTINLEQNENYDPSLDPSMLVGMGVYQGGTAINEQTGIINVNVTNGQAFYNDGTGIIINYGTICTFGNCQDSETYNPTDSDVSPVWDNGDVITAEGEMLALPSEGRTTNPIVSSDIYITNAGTVTGGAITVADYGHLTNETTGSINKVDIATGGEYTNQGTTATISVDGGVFNNEGTVTGQVGTTVAGSIINNTGSINTVEQWASTFYNTGTVTAWKGDSGSAAMNNEAGGTVNKVNFTAASTFNNAGTVHGGSVDKNGTFNNLEGGTVDLQDNGLWSGHFNNWGTVNGDADIATGGSGHTLYNGTTGVINGQITTANNNSGSQAINDGTINIDKSNNVAMTAHGSAKMVNNGTINVGSEGTTQTGMVGMQLASDATTNGVIENNGTINIYASNSYAFSKLGANGHIVNNGTVYIDDSVTGSGLIKQAGTAMEGDGEGGDGTEAHYVDFTAPEEPTITPYSANASVSSSSTNDLTGYVVGTNADGSTGKLMVNNASMNGVAVNTGFTAGTADTTVTFDNVVQGSNLTDADAITSTSVVWTAQGSSDTSGNVDVTMSKNAYADVTTDASVNDVAKALDAGYTNNELYTSLNVGTTAELNSALKQISGSQATTVFREARVLSNRFSMLADAAPNMGNGLAFNVVAKGDPRAELGNDTQYDMLALRKTLDLSESQTMSLEYGIARLDGDGAQKAGDNGVTGGYSQFFGLKHQMSFENGMSWNNALRYDVHNLDSSRSVAYGDVSKTADTDVKQQYMEFRSEGAKTYEPHAGLKLTPYAGVKFRHTLEDGYQERNAGDFNLNMNSGSETAVDSIVGLKLDYAGKDGWSATAILEGGPNLSYSKSQRTASLAGAGSQHFNVDDGQKGGGINSLASVGVKYSSKESSLNLDAYHWKEDGISDKGVMLNFKKTF
ncbi:autotransporter domain-containing protein [Escherichia albertii]